MFSEKEKVIIECCHNCYLHKEDQHSEKQFQQNYQARMNLLKIVQEEINRLWKNKPVEKNPKKMKPRINSFEIYYKKICLFSKIITGFFPKSETIVNMISILERSEQQCLQKLKMKISGVDIDFYSLLTERTQDKENEKQGQVQVVSKSEKISLKTIINYLKNLKPQIVRIKPISFKRLREKKVFKSQISKRNQTKTFRPVNNMMNSITYQSNQSCSDDLSLRLNTLNSMGDVQKNQRTQRSHKEKRISGFAKDFAVMKRAKYNYLSKQMDIECPYTNTENIDIVLDELTDEEFQSRTKIPNKADLKRKKKNRSSIRKRSFLKDRYQEQKMVKIREKMREYHQEDISDNEYKVNVKIAANQKENQQQIQKQEESLNSIQGPSQSSILSNYPKIQGEIVFNDNYFQIDSAQILDEYKIICLPRFMKRECYDYFEEQESGIFISSERNMIENVFMYLYGNYIDEIKRIFQYDLITMKKNQYLENYSPIIFNKDKGKFQVMYINNEFAYKKHDDQFIYQNPISNQCWPLILEKGLAKYYDGYRNLYNTIKVQDLLKMLTGAPLIFMHTIELQKVKKILALNYFSQSKAKRKGKVLCVGKNTKNSNVAFYFPQLIQFELNKEDILKSMMTVKLSQYLVQTYTYDSFSVNFDHLVLIFLQKNYKHNQLSMKYKPLKAKTKYDENGRTQNDQSTKSNTWNILIQVKQKLHSYIEYTLLKNTAQNNKTTIRISKIVDKEKKTEKSIKSRNSIPSKKEIKSLDVKKAKGKEKEKQKQRQKEYQPKSFELVGQIKKSKNFFFQVDLEEGLFLCEIQRDFQDNQLNSIHSYSSEEIVFRDSLISNQQVQGLTKSQSLYVKP